MKLNYNEFNFEHILICKYPDYKLSELDVIIILKADMLIKKGTKAITCPVLIPYLSNTTSKTDIDKSLQKLFLNKIIEISEKDNSCSIENFKKIVISNAIKDYYLEENITLSKDDSFYTEVEKYAKRTLSAYEREYITNWLKEGFLEEDIIQNIKLMMETIGNFNITAIDKRLKEDKDNIKEKSKNISDDFDSTSWMNNDD